jgi:hypothetical protein
MVKLTGALEFPRCFMVPARHGRRLPRLPPIRPFSCPGAIPIFQQRDTEGSDRSKDAEWAWVYGNSTRIG